MSVVTLLEYPQKIIAAKPLITFISQIKKGNYADSVDKLRDMYHRELDTLFDIQQRKIPRFSVAGNLRVESGRLELVSYSGYLFFEIKYLRPAKMDAVRILLEHNPFVFASFKNTLGLGICFIVKTEVSKELHEQMYLKVHRYFEKKLNIQRMQKDGKSIHHLCRMSYDSKAKVNIACIPFPYYGAPKF